MPPDIVRVAESTGQSVDRGHCGVERETGEIDLGWENGDVTSVEVVKNT